MQETIVTVATEDSEAEWENFLREHNVSHHAYSWKWQRIIPKIFGHTPHYLIAREPNGSISAILPLFSIKSLLFGRALISVPYLNAGGIVSNSPQAVAAMFAAVAEIGKNTGAGYCELRHVHPFPLYASDRIVRTHKMTMQLALQASPEDLFASFRPKLRSQVRRPSKDGVYAHISGLGLSEEDSLQAFYQVFSQHMRDLGTPVYPRSLFAEVKREFGDQCRIITVWFGNEPIAAGITVGNGSVVEIPWASALKSHNRKAPNMMLYWEAIKRASLDGFSEFDFGRSSPDSGPYRFKEQWGARPVKLHWYYDVYQGEIPDVNPNNPKYFALVTCWKRLPMPIANLLGPWLTKSIY